MAEPKIEKRMPVWAMILLDTVLTAAALGVFMLFEYVMPRAYLLCPTILIMPQVKAPMFRRRSQLPLRKIKRILQLSGQNRPKEETGAIRTQPTICPTAMQ